MKISTTLNLWLATTCSDLETRKDVMLRCKNAGFDTADIGFGGCGVLERDDWRDQILQIRAYADQIGLTFTQSHLPFYVPSCIHAENQEGDRNAFLDMLLRGVEAAGMLGAAWTVYHPVNALDCDRSPEEALCFNRERLLVMLGAAHRFHTGIAVENMAIHSRSVPLRRYCVTPEELCALCDSVNDPRLGICWDTGHANLMGLDQRRCLRLIGARLKAVHIQDNRGLRDDHLAPYMGNVDWPAVMQTLREIGYAGDLHFEAFGPTILPQPELKDALAVLLYRIGERLLTL